MVEFKEFRLTVYRRESDRRWPSGEPMVAISARGPLVGDTDENKYASEVGISYLSFYMMGHEFEGLMTGKVTGGNDIGHNVRAVGDSFTFFDMDFPKTSRGVFSVPYVTVRMPYYVRRILLRAVRAAWKRCAPGGERIEIEIPFALRERWARQYGEATGKVAWDLSDDSRALFDACKGRDNFDERIAFLEAVARGGTMRHTDVARVTLNGSLRDPSGFGFCIYRPDGSFRMNGGLIDHGRDGKADWSIHT